MQRLARTSAGRKTGELFTVGLLAEIDFHHDVPDHLSLRSL